LYTQELVSYRLIFAVFSTSITSPSPLTTPSGYYRKGVRSSSRSKLPKKNLLASA
jgi:hypothetical protein